jgi:hypothetical protein
MTPYRQSKIYAERAVVRLLARFSSELRYLLPLLGRELTFDAGKARRVLGFMPRPAAETVVDCPRSLIALPAGSGPGPLRRVGGWTGFGGTG